MSKVFEIAVCKDFKGEMLKINNVDAIAQKGIVNNRHFKENNEKISQITLIEVENINHYNQTFGTSIAPIDFRRNIITEGVRLNRLIGKEFFVGKAKLKGHDLCRPCKSLQNKLGKENIIKEFLKKGGLRCEILVSGKISVGDKIKI